MTSRCTIKLPKSGICPLCFYKTRQSNWARHVKRHHPEFTTPIYSENKNSSEQVEEINVTEPAQSSSKSSEIDLPMLQLKHFLNQQIQHNNLFGVDNEDKEELFPGRRIIIRRPANGVCQFCLKQISASNWSRHLRSLHLPDIFEMKKQELMLNSSKNDLQQIPQNSQNNLDSTQILNEMTLSATATACETKEINIESFEEQVEGEENNEREDSVDKTIASSKSIIRLPKTNICPLCERQVSPGNWSRHLKRHHPDYALSPEEEDEQINGEDNLDDYNEEEEEMATTNSTCQNETPTEEQALLWALCQEELDVQSSLANANKKVESIRKKMETFQNVLSSEEVKIRELKLKAEQLAERRKELLLKRQEIVQNANSAYQTWNCPDFDNSCRWHNSIWPPSSILWFRSSVPIDAVELQLLTNTNVLPDLYYAISAFGPVNNTSNNNTVVATLISEPIDCQRGTGNLTFNYWVSPFVQLTVCIKLSGQPLNFSNDCQKVPITHQGPGPAVIMIPEPRGQFQDQE
uniref:C2H2-type domain-containing protein n=1 Tax=Meloidogyne javanica TaxID=6303 RepID=A0A915MHE7_MELJA